MGCRECLGRNAREFTNAMFWLALIAELLGTFILVFAGCSSCVNNVWNVENSGFSSSEPSTKVQIALTFGIAVATVVWCICHVSGGHINPAVTVAMLLTRKVTLVRAILYIIVQCVGAIAGAGILKLVNPPGLKHQLGYTMIQPPLSAAQGFGVELIITFVLVFTVFSSCDKRRNDTGGSIPLTIGLSVALCHFFAIKYTGSSMNPARSFGPAVIGGKWKHHWIYWIGPILGGIIAGLLYELVFAVDASVSKLKAMFTTRGPDGVDDDDRDDILPKDRPGSGYNSADNRVSSTP